MSRWTVHAVDAESGSARIPAWRGTHRLFYAVNSLVAKDLWRRPVRATRAETVARTGRQARSSRLADVSPLTRLVNRMQIRTRVTDRAGNEGSSDVVLVQILGAVDGLTVWLPTADPVDDDALLQNGDLQLSDPLDLDQSPGTSQSGTRPWSPTRRRLLRGPSCRAPFSLAAGRCRRTSRCN